MTVTDCHHEKTAVQKRKHAKKFSLFGKGLQMTDIDLHHFFFHRLEERSFSHTKQKNLCRLTFLVVLSYNKEKTTAETTATNR